MRMPESDWGPFIARLAGKKGDAVAASAKHLLERTIALPMPDECRIVTFLRRTPTRWRQDVCVDADESRTRLYWINDIGVLIFELSSSNTPKKLPPLCTYPAFAAPGVLDELASRLKSVADTERHDTRITIKNVTLLDGESLDDFIATIHWMIGLIADHTRRTKRAVTETNA